jgi:GH24 family phage-related lysozyme (muramidase)
MEPKHRSKELEAARHPPLPRIGEQVVVQCEGYRCLAYRDKEGKWRSALGGELLPNVLKVLEQF